MNTPLALGHTALAISILFATGCAEQEAQSPEAWEAELVSIEQALAECTLPEVPIIVHHACTYAVTVVDPQADITGDASPDVEVDDAVHNYYDCVVTCAGTWSLTSGQPSCKVGSEPGGDYALPECEPEVPIPAFGQVRTFSVLATSPEQAQDKCKPSSNDHALCLGMLNGLEAPNEDKNLICCVLPPAPPKKKALIRSGGMGGEQLQDDQEEQPFSELPPTTDDRQDDLP